MGRLSSRGKARNPADLASNDVFSSVSTTGFLLKQNGCQPV
jgi:hypothetical protein